MGYPRTKRSRSSFKMKSLKNIFNAIFGHHKNKPNKVKRECLCLLYEIITDKAQYVAYETETAQGLDCVNIEIERTSIDNKSLILEQELFEDSWGAMGGESFSRLILSSKYLVYEFIKHNHEIVKIETKFKQF